MSLKAASQKLETMEIHPVGKTHSATVIFLHALADSGSNFTQWIRFLLARPMDFGHIKMIFPTALRNPFTLFNGAIANIWHDVYGNIPSMDLPERRQSFELAYELIQKIIQKEIDNGIPANRIIIGGFSMGGTIALHMAYHVQRPQLAGVFALSTYLHYDSIVYETLTVRFRQQEDEEQQSGTIQTKLLMVHGEADDMVPAKWGLITFDELKRCGVDGEFNLLKGVGHEMKTSELVQVERWIVAMLPPLAADVAHKL